METTYAWERGPGGGTRMGLLEPRRAGGLLKLAAPLMAAAMRRANRKDLRRLKQLLEASAV